MAVVVTATKPTGVQDTTFGNKKVKIRDITFDTGTYVTGGNAVTAASLGLKRIDYVGMGTQVATGGTAGATANPVGVTYAAAGTSVTFQQYETGAVVSTALDQKTSAEATAANFTFRCLFIGY